MTKLFFLCLILFSHLTFARPTPLEKVQSSQVDSLNIIFDTSVVNLFDKIEICPSCGDVVGNGHGGDVVGNGGGLIETKLHFYNQNMSTILKNVLSQVSRSLPPYKVEVLEKIKKMVENKKSPTELIFVSGIAGHEFFKDDQDLIVRAAKTGFSEVYPIYFNVDLLYQMSGNEDVSLLGILIHELGHQAGYRSHTSLDQIAAIVERYYKASVKSLDTIEIDDTYLTFNYFNLDCIIADAHLFLEWDNEILYAKKLDYVDLMDVCGMKVPGGYRYLNMHWDNFIQEDSQSLPQYFSNSSKLKAKGVLEVKCLYGVSDVQKVYRPIEILIDIQDAKMNIEQRIIIDK